LKATTDLLGGPIRVSQEFPGLDQWLAGPHDYTAADYYSWRKFPHGSDGYLYRLERHRARRREAEEEYGRRKVLS
jgi:hypothetical protein